MLIAPFQADCADLQFNCLTKESEKVKKLVHHFDLTTMGMSLYFLTVFVSKTPIDPSVST